MISLVARLLIIFISIITIPYLISLISNTRHDWPTDQNQKNTRWLLLSLFSVMLVGACLSVLISGLGLFTDVFVDIPLADISRARTLFLTVGNFILAIHFYNLQK